MHQYTMSLQEWNTVKDICYDIQTTYDSPLSSELLDRLPCYNVRIPVNIIEVISLFRRWKHGPGILRISPPDEKSVKEYFDPKCNTPTFQNDNSHYSNTYMQDIYLLLVSSVLAEPFGWALQQGGKLIQDVVSIPGHETEQLGTSSDCDLMLHTEDAFEEHRAEFIALLCLRNHEQARTTYSYVDIDKLSKQSKNILFEKNIYIYPDKSYSDDYFVDQENSILSQNARNNIKQNFTQPKVTSILFGDTQSPYLLFDPIYMEPVEKNDKKINDAYEEIIHNINGNKCCKILKPGEILFLNNYVCVHGRDKYKPIYNGKNRWLKRLHLTTDLMKKAALNEKGKTRIFYGELFTGTT